MNIQSPESKGLSSSLIELYLRRLEEAHLVTHDIIIARGNSIVFEHYVKPFHADFPHREYSVSKSIVSLAVGFALDDNLLKLDDPISKYFEKELEGQTDENFRNQTIRNMLMMSTAKTSQDWFGARTDDRVRFYFQNDYPESRPAGSYFEYDSTGSFVLGALVERLTGMRLTEYLRGKLFDRIGVSRSAHFLTCPGGHSWGDSAALMTARDLLKIARFTLNGGSWDGEQLISADYIREATSCQISTSSEGFDSPDGQGYGYLIWRTWGNSFFFNGMGCQFAVCDPDTDMILIYNGDNQGNNDARKIIINTYFDILVKSAVNHPLPTNASCYSSLCNYAASLSLASAYGNTLSPMSEIVDSRNYGMAQNPMGISFLSLRFEGDRGEFVWQNAQGRKKIFFGMGKNEFGTFPQEGYSDEVGSQPGKGLYGCAASAAWTDRNTLWMKVQLIGDYFGNFDAYFRFSPDGRSVRLSMRKTAEDFLREYQGDAAGEML